MALPFPPLAPWPGSRGPPPPWPGSRGPPPLGAGSPYTSMHSQRLQLSPEC